MRITAILLLLLTPASAQQMFDEMSDEWRKGYCFAVEQSMRNRDHYRAMVRFPAETLKQSMERIYAKWPPEPPAGFAADNIVAQGLVLEMAGIDLYVILPDEPCK